MGSKTQTRMGIHATKATLSGLDAEHRDAQQAAPAAKVPHVGASHSTADSDLQQCTEQSRILSELVSEYAYSFVIEPDGTMRGDWLSDSFIRVFGLTIEEIDARGGWASMVYPEDLSIAFQHAANVMRGEHDECELRFVTRDGELRWVHDQAAPVWSADEDRVTRILGAARDITKEKQVEKTRR